MKENNLTPREKLIKQGKLLDNFGRRIKEDGTVEHPEVTTERGVDLEKLKKAEIIKLETSNKRKQIAITSLIIIMAIAAIIGIIYAQILINFF